MKSQVNLAPAGNHIRQTDRIVFNIISYTVVTIFGLACLLPFILVLVTSFTSESSLMRNGYTFFIKEFSLKSYSLAFRNPQRIIWAYRNTLFVTIAGTCCSVLLSTMTGYVLSRPNFPQRNKVSLFFFFTTLFSGGLVPWYILCVRYLGFRDTYVCGIAFPAYVFRLVYDYCQELYEVYTVRHYGISKN